MLKQKYTIIRIAQDLLKIHESKKTPIIENSLTSAECVRPVMHGTEFLDGIWTQETVVDTTDEVREYLSCKEHPERFIALPVLVYDPMIRA